MDNVLNQIGAVDPELLSEYKQNLMVGGGSPGPCLVSGKGVRVNDINGKSYIDCTSQSWALYLGYCNEEIRECVYEHMSKLSHVHQGFDTQERASLAHKLASLAPEHLNRVSFTVGGGPAIEAAMKIAMKNVPGAQHFINLWESYHGSTLTTVGASWPSTKSAGKFVGPVNFLPNINTNFIRVPNPYCYRCYFDQKDCANCNMKCIEMLRLTMEKGVCGQVAGIIVEPIQASGGQIPLPKKYLQELRKICDEFGCLLIFDEIQTYCRIGDYFAANYYGVEPDIIVLGKALGAGFPIAAIIIHDRLEGFGMGAEELHTFANNSVSQVAALKQLEIIERDKILDNVNRVGGHIAAGLRDMVSRYPEIGDIRQVGLHIGIEMIDPNTGAPMCEDKAKAIRSYGMSDNGIIMGTGGFKKHVLKIKPPLITTMSEADEILERFEGSLKMALR
ncbi:MAG: aspartate aminotransferase family protein [Ruminococcaceae bacterium]|nr:aspartate aminotransferase family protein [Oscillospiraceae bacterium]